MNFDRGAIHIARFALITDDIILLACEASLT
jgi:hypothetical protein